MEMTLHIEWQIAIQQAARELYEEMDEHDSAFFFDWWTELIL